MTETAPAAVAAPVAPVAAPAPAVAPAPAPAAVATTPAPAPAPAVTATVATGESVLDLVTPAPVPVAPVAAPATTTTPGPVVLGKGASGPNNIAAWNLNDTVPGSGDKPAWFKSDKYANVAKQAEAYVALEQRFGSFTGAPKDEQGNVKYTMPSLEADNVVITDPNHPVLQEFQKLAGELQLNQTGYNKLLGMMAQYEASKAPDPVAEKAKLGPNADARITAVVNWAQNNLDQNGFQLMRAVTAGDEMAQAFALMEQVIAKTGTMKMPKPGDDVATAGPQGLAAIQAKQAAKNSKGQRLYEIDPAYRRSVEAELTAHFAANPVVRDRQGNIRG